MWVILYKVCVFSYYSSTPWVRFDSVAGHLVKTINNEKLS